MKILSLNLYQNRWHELEIEVSFIPGLPQVHFLGHVDPTLKESALRIKSAFRACGYDFPKAHQVVVNLKPKHIKKMSPGIELPLALVILKMTGQGPDWSLEDYTVFGDISLDGEIQFPDSSIYFESQFRKNLLSGKGSEKFASGYQLSHLKELNDLRWVDKVATHPLLRPEPTVFSLSSQQARVLKILAVGEHHSLLAGSQGTGKSLILDVLPRLLRGPEISLLEEHRKTFSRNLSWRPQSRPHHTTTPQSMVGGGVPPRPGEITRAHGGVLFLDEMMEFKVQALEVLREALSSREVTVSRGLISETFQADFQLVGTTNLCPCGKWTPGQLKNCGYSQRRCLSTLQKISGPLMDRVQTFFFFADRKANWTESLEDLEEKILKIQEFQKAQQRGQGNRFFAEAQLTEAEKSDWLFWTQQLAVSSARRRQAWLAVARTLADLELRETINRHHFEEAYTLSIENYQKLLKWGAGSG